MLCFDGDKAGRRAAYRAVDLALPRLRPARACASRCCPKGRTPTISCAPAAARRWPKCSAARARSPTCSGRARPRAASFDTPERRAALEARISEIVARHRRRGGAQILPAGFRRAAARSCSCRSRAPGRGGTRYGGLAGGSRGQRGGRGWQRLRGAQPGPGASRWRRPAPRLGTSPIVRGFRSALPPREALILLAGDQPSVAAGSTMPRNSPSSNSSIPTPTCCAARSWKPASTTPTCRTSDDAAGGARRAGLGPLLARVEAAITHTSDWPARAGTATGDVAQWWTHVVTLHRKQRTLNRELKDAERALGEEPSDANLAWLRDVQAGLVGARRHRGPDRGFWGVCRAGRSAAFEPTMRVWVLSAGSGTE